MEVTLDKKQLNLLMRLSEVLRDPDAPSLLESLDLREPPLRHLRSPSPTQQSDLSLLQRMNGSTPSRISKEQSIPSEAKIPRKRLLSPQSSESSGRSLMSRLHNPKRIRHSTPILTKFSQSSPHLKTPELMKISTQAPQDLPSRHRQKTLLPHKDSRRSEKSQTQLVES